LKSKIILSGLFLTGAVSCASFKPLILTNAFLDPLATAVAEYDAINWSTALFNQYASGLDYTFRMNYSTLYLQQLNDTVIFNTPSGAHIFNEWTTITSSYAEGKLSDANRARLNLIFFERNFNRTTKLPATNNFLQFLKLSQDNVNVELIIKSKIKYNVSVGSILLSYLYVLNAAMTSLIIDLTFYSDDNVLQTIRLGNHTPASATIHGLYDVGTIITGVNRFDLKFQWTDIPPYATSNSGMNIYEFNLFTQGQEISIPNDTDGDRFGFEFVAVEWWNILGHLQNFIWWIINQSPIAPVFEWIEDYVITWVSGLITFITGVFRL
jgi:hypothetical protein